MMRVYHGAPSPENLRKCRKAAPSHVHGACWTPQKMVAHEVPYFIDNGAFTEEFDPEAWRDLLATVDEEMPHPPDFVVLPDAFNDADGTLARHREYAEVVLDHGFEPAPVLQPGRSVTSQVAIADGLGADIVFLGGECRWQRAHGEEIVEEAHDRGLCVHIGNPGSSEGLVWAYRVGFDSVDTSSILQNQYFHWLEDLEVATHSSRGYGKKASRQSVLSEVTRVAE
ncbi:hypothetical protein [Halobacterium bonnevillei]|uniref:hypothetical protein n=1 Tax=Halobacterium bonnevillei TaxID=2692200 RepID=UPI001914F1C2|nr:hypothetical protein [Halobacterium bonnevillei]